MIKIENGLKFFSISEKVLEKFPQTQVGILSASFDNSENSSNQKWIESVKKALYLYLIQKDITKENFTSHKSIDSWRNAYKTFEVKPKSYPSSVESLIKRVLKQEKIWKISPIVDLYNIVSVLSLLPMGGYDTKKIKGNEISLDFSKEGEIFEPLGKEEEIKTKNSQVVYKDSNGERNICWLWNYKDSRHTFIDNETREAVFFIDSIEKESDNVIGNVKHSLEMLSFLIEKYAKGKVFGYGIASKNNPKISIEQYTLPKISKEHFDNFFDSILENKKEVKEKEYKPFHEPQGKNLNFHCFETNPEDVTQSDFTNLCAIGDFNEVTRILKLRKDLSSSVDYFENSGLIHSARGNHHKMIEILLEYNPKILNHQNKIGETAIFVAARFANKDFVKKLLEYNVDLSIKNNENKTVLDICIEKSKNSDPSSKKEYIEIIELIEKLGMKNL